MHHCDSFLQRLTVALIEPCVCCALRAVLGAIRCEPAVISICAFCIVTAAFTQTVLLYLYTTAVVYTGFGARPAHRGPLFVVREQRHGHRSIAHVASAQHQLVRGS